MSLSRIEVITGMNMHYFLYALGFSIVTIIVGLYLFIKKQDEFILQI